MLLRTLAGLMLALIGPGAHAQSGTGLDLLREALAKPLAGRQASPPSAPGPVSGQEQAVEQDKASAAANGSMPAAAPQGGPAARTADAAPGAAPAATTDIEQWSTELAPRSEQSPYVVLAGMRFETLSNPCPDGKGRCWAPVALVPMAGALATGQEVHVTYKVAGKPWFTERFRASDATALLRNRQTRVLLYRFRSGRNHAHLARHTGRIDFEVTHADPLGNSSRKLASGHFVVGKVAAGVGGPDQVDYHVSYDWATEVMTIDFMRGGSPALDQPNLTVSAVFLQPEERKEAMSLHLFYGGREIASTPRWLNEWSVAARNQNTRAGYGAFGTAWVVPNVVGYDRRGSPGHHVLANHPGEYTVKILRNGELAREASFTITPDGRIDRSLNVAAQLHHGYTLVRAKVHGQQDRARPNFRSDGLWGNAEGLK